MSDQTVKKVLDYLKSNGGGISKVIEEWHEGTEWYRVWSSGLIEQGGEIECANGIAAITLPKPYSDANYHATAMCFEDIVNSTAVVCKYSVQYPRTTSSLTLKVTWVNPETMGTLNGKITWSAIGY